MLDGKAAKENYIHDAMRNPHFFIVSGGTTWLTDIAGNPCSATYIMGKWKAEVDKAPLPENGIMNWSVYEDDIKYKSNKSKKS